VSQAFDAAGIPSYATESGAIAGFMHLVRYRETRELLMATPRSMPQDFVPDVAAVRPIIDGVVREKRTWLDPIEMARMFAAYGISITRATLAHTANEAVAAAKPYLAAGTPVVLKIQSPDIVHKSEVGGVRLNLANERGVRAAATEIFDRARAEKPNARITGVAVFPMIVRPKARELIVGVADGPTFGPVIVFGQGGTAVEVISDKALALPRLDLALARRLIARTRVARILGAYRNVPAADERAIELLLVKLAQLVADFPEIREIDLNPVLADETGVIAVDARVAVAPIERRRGGSSGHPRFAIRPYPEGMGAAGDIAGWEYSVRSAGAARGRAALWAIPGGSIARRFAPALLRAGQGFQPCLHRPLRAAGARVRDQSLRRRGCGRSPQRPCRRARRRGSQADRR
jgi:acetyltransferase